VKGVSEKLKRTGNRYSIRMIFRTKHTLMSSLLKTRLERNPQQMASVSKAFFKNVAEATLVKQADL
jgi:hypothetical protein